MYKEKEESILNHSDYNINLKTKKIHDISIINNNSIINQNLSFVFFNLEIKLD